MADILEQLEAAWEEDHKINLAHYCDLAAQEIRQLRAAILNVGAINRASAHFDPVIDTIILDAATRVVGKETNKQ